MHRHSHRSYATAVQVKWLAKVGLSNRLAVARGREKRREGVTALVTNEAAKI